MNNELVGFVELDSDKIIKACEEYLKIRADRVHSQREALIQKTIASTKGKWFGKKNLSREQAIDRIPKDHLSEWHSIKNRGSYWAHQVEVTADAASTAPKMLLSAEMAQLLKKYIK